MPGSSHYDRVKARYEQHIVLENDEHAVSKIFRHTLADIFTLFIAEIWYAKVRETYQLHVVNVDKEKQKEAEKEEKFKAYYIGKTKKQLILDFGLPDYTEDDGEGGKILTYENSIGHSNTSRSGAAFFRYSSNTKTEDFETKKRMWFAVDKNNIIYAVGFRTKYGNRVKRYKLEKNKQ